MASKKGAAAALLIFVAGGLTYAQIKKATPGPDINNGNTGDEFGRPQERRGMFEEIAREAKITPDQQKKIEELREKGDWREMRTQMADVLTTEQREIVREQMQERFQQRRAERDAKMRSAMGATEFKRYQEKREERFRNRGGRGGPGGPGGGPSRGPEGSTSR